MCTVLCLAIQVEERDSFAEFWEWRCDVLINPGTPAVFSEPLIQTFFSQYTKIIGLWHPYCIPGSAILRPGGNTWKCTTCRLGRRGKALLINILVLQHGEAWNAFHQKARSLGIVLLISPDFMSFLPVVQFLPTAWNMMISSLASQLDDGGIVVQIGTCVASFW